MSNYHFYFREQFIAHYRRPRAKGACLRFTTHTSPMNCDQILRLYHAAVRANLCSSGYKCANELELSTAIEANISLRLITARPGENDRRLAYATNPDDDPQPDESVVTRESVPDSDSSSDPDNEWQLSSELRAKLREDLEPQRAHAAWVAYIPPVFDPFRPPNVEILDGLDYLYCVKQ
jgi:hypothetical protein